VTITLKNVPRALHLALKRQAKANKRSLNQDLMKYLEERAETGERQKAFAAAIRHRDELAQKGVKIPRGLEPERIIRQDRDRR